jgi:cyclohexyl-isocyanide hydratase
MTTHLHIGFLLYPQVTPLDLIGPAQVFAAAGGFTSHFIAKDRTPVMSDAGLALLPTATFADCVQLDVLLVPGGPGQPAVMGDAALLRWLARQGAAAGWVMSVCSGSLLLGAAGLLQGYRAACHWAYREHLAHFRALPDPSRVVRDRNRITGGGVTAGIDSALCILAELRGDAVAQEVQLLLEYAPEPPFDCGRPERATPALIAGAKARLEAQIEAAEAHIAQAAAAA